MPGEGSILPFLLIQTLPVIQSSTLDCLRHLGSLQGIFFPIREVLAKFSFKCMSQMIFIFVQQADNQIRNLPHSSHRDITSSLFSSSRYSF